MEDNKKNVLNNQTNNEEGKKKKKGFSLWWHNLGKGGQIALCCLLGAGVVTAITVPTVLAARGSSSEKKTITCTSTDVNFSSSFEADGSLKAKIKSTTKYKELTGLEIKIGDYTLKDSEYTFNKKTGDLNVAATIIKAHKGNVVISPSLIEVKFAKINWDETPINDTAHGFNNKTLFDIAGAYNKADAATSIIFKKDASTDGANVGEDATKDKIYAKYEDGALTIWSNDRIEFEDNDLVDSGRYGPFFYCRHATSIELNNIDTSSMTSLCNMFSGCKAVESLDVSNIDTSNATDISGMFGGCKKLTTIDLSSFDTSKVTKMDGLFCNEEDNELTSITFGSNFKTTNITDMCNMFQECSKLTTLDLSSFDTSKITNTNYMFQNCSELTTIYVAEGTDLSTATVTTDVDMFKGCVKLEGQEQTKCDGSTNIDKTYARVDKAKSTPSVPGYFSVKK